jgi:hypothetical protein
MAGWGTGSFENEDATGWLAELSTVSPDELTQILFHAADDPGYLEAPAASVAVAAAEVVAVLKGSSGAGVLPPAVAEWTKNNTTALTPEVKALAIRALERVRKNSELRDLWLEAEGLNDWTTALQDLRNRLEN